jgi:alkanesulfonate monooxygenase SsuD/methylene tetrahydromethanopterin reductase-like flavin-dependent oxidoreductase (luciferase family)
MGDDSAWVTHPWVANSIGKTHFGVFGGPMLDWPKLVAFVRLAEELGFDSYWTPDHPANIPDWGAALASLAVSTERIRLGVLASCVYYRSPVTVARQAADVDRLSGGRMILGLGVGDVAHEFTQFGMTMPPASERHAVLHEALQIIRGLWGETPFTFEGKHFRVNEANVRPSPVQQPRLPILIAGVGERFTFRRVAQYADASNFGAHPFTGGIATMDEVRRKLAVLDRHCADEGRTANSVLRSHVTMPLVLAGTLAAANAKVDQFPDWVANTTRRVGVMGTPEDATAYYRALLDTGINYVIVRIWQDDVETLRLLATEVMPALRASSLALAGGGHA